MQLQSFGCKSTNIIRRHFKNPQGCKLTLKKLNSDSVKKSLIMRTNIIFTNFKKYVHLVHTYVLLQLLDRLIWWHLFLYTVSIKLSTFAKFQMLTKLRINRALKTLSIKSELLNSQSILNGLLGFPNWEFILLPCPFARWS